ncbi:MAG: CPBP family intramembrane glutamic endopeptidase [Planctomycetota bacterium]
MGQDDAVHDGVGASEPQADSTSALLAGLAIYSGFSLISLAICIWGVRLFSGPGLDRKGARDLDPIPTTAWFAAAGLAWLVVPITAGIGVGIATASGDDPTETIAAAATDIRFLGLTQSIAYGLSSIACLALAWFIARKAPNAGLRARPVDAIVGPGTWMLIVPFTLVAGSIAALAAAAFAGESPEPITHDTLRTISEERNNPWMWGLALSATVGAGVVEEITYRGLLQSGFRRLTKSPWAAIVATSTIFTLMHWSVVAEGRHALAVIFVLSIALGAAFERTKSIAVPIIAHAMFNAMQILAVLAG